MGDNVILVSFDDNNKVYEGFSRLKALSDQGQVTARSAAVVERDDTGTLQMKDGFDNETGIATAGGSLTGMLVGVLGGPVGMLLGLSGGALAGGAYDARRADEQDEVLTKLNAAINPGHAVLVSQVNEPTVQVLDKEMEQLGGIVVRHSEDEVLAEMEAAEDAADEAQKAARKAMRERKMTERKEKREERIAALKAKFSHH